MIKPTLFLGLVLLAFVAYIVYEVENRVDSMRNDLLALNERIERDKQAIQVLKAEWAYLNKPDRLKKYSNSYLALQNIQSTQVGGIEQIPFKNRSLASNDNFR